MDPLTRRIRELYDTRGDYHVVSGRSGGIRALGGLRSAAAAELILRFARRHCHPELDLRHRHWARRLWVCSDFLRLALFAGLPLAGCLAAEEAVGDWLSQGDR